MEVGNKKEEIKKNTNSTGKPIQADTLRKTTKL